jgi:hypothetical protein
MKMYSSTIFLILLSLNICFSQKTLFTKRTTENWNFKTQKWENNESYTDYLVFQNKSNNLANSYFISNNGYINVGAERSFIYDEKNRLIEQTTNYINSRAFANFRTKYTIKYQYTPFDSVAIVQEYVFEDSLKQKILLSEKRISYNNQNRPILEKYFGLENSYKKSLNLKEVYEVKFEYDEKGQLKVFDSTYEKIRYKRNVTNLIEEVERMSKEGNNFSFISRIKYDEKNRTIRLQSIFRNIDNNTEEIKQQTVWEYNDLNNTIFQTYYSFVDSLNTLLPTYYTFDQLDKNGRLIHKKYFPEKDTIKVSKDGEILYEYYENGLLKKETNRSKTGAVSYMDATFSSEYVYDSERRVTEILRNEIGISPEFSYKYYKRFTNEYGEIKEDEIEMGEFTLYPNPARDNFKVSNILIEGCAYSVDLINFNGIKLQEYFPKYNNGYALCEWDCAIPASIQNGQYIVVVNKTNGTKDYKRIWIDR